MSRWAQIKAGLVATGAIVLAVLGAIGLAMRQARQDGINQVEREQQERRDALQEQYDEIDSSPPDLDAALGRLQSRAQRDR